MEELKIKIYGARGSIITPSKKNEPRIKYGSETTSYQILNGKTSLLIDAGSGIRQVDLPSILNKDAHLFFTHAHDDHICGLGFFTPAYIPESNITLHASPEHLEAIKKYFNLNNRLFPVDLEFFNGIKEKDEFKPYKTINLESMDVTPVPLNHPQGGYGFVVEAYNKKIALLWDVEHERDLNNIGTGNDEKIISHMEGADIVIADGQYLPKEYDPEQIGEKGVCRVGWGHCVDEKLIQLGIKAGIENLVITHHDPSHLDGFIDNRLKELKNKFPKINLSFAKEGDTIYL